MTRNELIAQHFGAKIAHHGGDPLPGQGLAGAPFWLLPYRR